MYTTLNQTIKFLEMQHIPISWETNGLKILSLSSTKFWSRGNDLTPLILAFWTWTRVLLIWCGMSTDPFCYIWRKARNVELRRYFIMHSVMQNCPSLVSGRAVDCCIPFMFTTPWGWCYFKLKLVKWCLKILFMVCFDLLTSQMDRSYSNT